MNKRSPILLAIFSLFTLIIVINCAKITSPVAEEQTEQQPESSPTINVTIDDKKIQKKLSLIDIHNLYHNLSAEFCNPGQDHYVPERDKDFEFNYNTLPDRVQDVLKCLASCIYFEAGTENRKHKLYVGSVVLNRYECKFRGKTTIESICLDKKQFSARMQTYKSPESWKEVSEESKLAAYELLLNGSILPHDVLYFDIDPKEHKVYEALKNNYTKYGEMTYFGY